MDYLERLKQILLEWGLNHVTAMILSSVILIFAIIVISYLAYLITSKIILVIVRRLIYKSKNEYDNIIFKHKVFNYLIHLIPALIIYYTIPIALPIEKYYSVIQTLTYLYVIIAMLLLVNRFLSASNEILDIISEKKHLNISFKGYVQIVKIIVIIIAIILIIAIISNKEPTTIFAGFGAMTAILLLIFKDIILGFVASIQLSAYNMLKVGDRITMANRDVDGDVIDISLTTVKVKNLDTTISNIPTYALVTESFVNWQGMKIAGARRIARAINIDINSIKFCTQEMIDKFKKIHYLTDYINTKQNELQEWNLKNNIDNSITVNGKRMTNIGVFRIYIENYIADNLKIYHKIEKKNVIIDGYQIQRFHIPDKLKFIEHLQKNIDNQEHKEDFNIFLQEIEGQTYIKDVDKLLLIYEDKFVLENNIIYYLQKIKNISTKSDSEVKLERLEKIVEKEGLFYGDMTYLVRQLAQIGTNVPMQIYVFAATTRWTEYEKIQSDLFDHLFAIIPEFDLRVN